jgi:hypothetical protein
MREGTPNPFVKACEFNAYPAKLEQDFNEALAEQKAAVGRKN